MKREELKREVVKAFKSEYERLQPKSCKDYDMRRNRATTYSSRKIKEVLRVSSWKEVLLYCGIENKRHCFEITEFILEVI